MTEGVYVINEKKWGIMHVFSSEIYRIEDKLDTEKKVTHEIY